MNARATFKLFRSAALAAGLALTLSGCESFDITNLIPDSKKKLPGERREVFPGGTPGVPQGVPAELVKGYQAPPETAEEPAPVKKKEAAKPKPKARPTPSVAPEVAQQPQSGQAQQGQWPSQQQKPAQQSAWPQSPQPGTFAR